MGIKTLTHNDLKFYLGVIQLETDLVPFYAGLAFVCSTFLRQFCSAQYGLVWFGAIEDRKMLQKNIVFLFHHG